MDKHFILKCGYLSKHREANVHLERFGTLFLPLNGCFPSSTALREHSFETHILLRFAINSACTQLYREIVFEKSIKTGNCVYNGIMPSLCTFFLSEYALCLCKYPFD